MSQSQELIPPVNSDSFHLLLPDLFQSPSQPSHSIQYVHLNSSGTDTVLYCPGAGGVSREATYFQPFTAEHPELSILYIDRWTIGPSYLRTSGLSLLQDLTNITIELLDHLGIQKVSLFAHSAGAWQACDLAKHHADRILNFFCASTMIPSTLTNSNLAKLVPKLPDLLFTGAMKLDQMDHLEKYWMKLNGKSLSEREDSTTFIDTKYLRSLVKSYTPSEKEKLRNTQTLDVDYKLGWQRFEDVTGVMLEEMYLACPVDITWFTTDGDVLFGPGGVENVRKRMRTAKVEVIVVEGGSHADIMMRREVWEEVVRRL